MFKNRFGVRTLFLRSRVLSLLAVSTIGALPLTFNACGKFHSTEGSSNGASQSARSLSFDSTRIAPFAKSSLTLTGSCFSGQNVSIQVDSQPAEAATCSGGTFSHTLQLSGVDGPKVIVASTQYKGQSFKDSITVTKDTQSPVATIIAALPSGADVVVNGTCENGLELILSGDILSASSAVCGNGVFQAAVRLKTGPVPLSLTVSQVDRAGNLGTGTFSYTPDTTPPALVINSPAANSFVKAAMTVAGLCESGFPVQLSGASLVKPIDLACANGTFSSSVSVDGAEGVKTFTFAQTDAAGNKTEKTVSVTKDTVAPALTVTAPVAGAALTTDMVTVSGTCESGLTVKIQGAGISAAVNAVCNGGAFSAMAILSAGNGNKTIDVVEADLAGNETKVSRMVSKTTVLNNLAITLPAAGLNTKGALTLTGTCDNGATLTFAGDIQAAASVVCASGAFSRSITLSAGDGMKTVNVSQSLDGAMSSAGRNFVLDTTAPTPSVVSPTANTNVKAMFVVSGACENGLQVALSGSGLSAGLNTSCTNGVYSIIATASNGDGAKTFAVTQTDAAGNTGTASRTVNRMTNANLLTIVQPHNGDSVKASAIVSGACESGITVALSGGITAVNAACSMGLYSQTVNFSSGEGQKTVNVQQMDTAGNIVSASVSLNKDTAAPNLTIASPAADTKAATGLTITGACETGLTVKVSGSGAASEVSGPCVLQAYSLNFVFTNGDGNKSILVSSTDLAGNSTSVSRQFVKGVVDLLPAAKAVLDQYCTKCHGPGGQAAYADFTLATSAEFVTKGWVVAGNIDQSKLIYRIVHYNGSTGGVARNMPLNATATFPVSAYNTLVNWVQQMSPPTAPPVANSFACLDANLVSQSASYTLTKEQYQNTVTDLFGAAALTGLTDVLSALPRDTYDAASYQRTSALSAGKIDSYFNLAKGISANMTANNTVITAVFGACAVTAAPAATCIDTYIAGFAKKSSAAR